MREDMSSYMSADKVMGILTDRAEAIDGVTVDDAFTNVEGSFAVLVIGGERYELSLKRRWE